MKIESHLKYFVSKIFYFFILSQLLFAVIYRFFIKEKLLKKIQFLDDPEDPVFYFNIFNNLEYAILIVITLLIILYLIRKKIFNIIYNTDLKIIILASLFSSFLIQAIVLIFVKTELLADSIYYYKVSESFFYKGEYYSDYGFKSSFWPIGLPLIMAGLKHIYYDNLLLTRILNILINLGLVLISYSCFNQYLNEIQKKIFIIFFSFLPFLIFGSNSILTDIYFTFFLYLSIFFITRKSQKLYNYFLAGLSIGISAYMRPVGLILPFIFIIYFYSSKKINFNFTFVLLFSFALIISPWMIRNYAVFNTLVPMTTNGGFNFLIGNNENSWGKVNFNFDYNIANNNEVEESELAYKKGWKAIKNNPIKSILRIPAKLFFSYWRGDSYFIWTFKKTNNEIHPLLLSVLFYFVNLTFYFLIVLSIISYIKNSKQFGSLIKLFNILITSCILMILVYVGSDRYILPLIPIHVLFALKYFKLDLK